MLKGNYKEGNDTSIKNCVDGGPLRRVRVASVISLSGVFRLCKIRRIPRVLAANNVIMTGITRVKRSSRHRVFYGTLSFIYAFMGNIVRLRGLSR